MAYGSFYDQLLAATGKGTPNYSLYAVPAMWVINMSAHFMAILVFSGGKFTNVAPREYVQSVSRKEKKTASEQMLVRAEAAQMNGFENIGWFAAAIVAANVAKLPAEELNALAGTYLASRVLYNALYIFVQNEITSFLRSAVYLVGVAINFTLYIRAGSALK